MSYCTLDEAWGEPLKCSRTNNSSGKKNGVSYKIKNELPCDKPTPFANDPIEDDNIYYLQQNQRNQINKTNSKTNSKTNYNLVNTNSNEINNSNQNDYSSINTNCDQYSYLDENTQDECNKFSEYPQDGNIKKTSTSNNINQDNLDIINSKNFNNGPQPLNPYNDEYGNVDYLNSDNDDNDSDNDDSDVNSNNRNRSTSELNMNDLVESENLNLKNNDIQDTQNMLLNILDRLDVLETKINNSKNKKNNVHDIIVFIIIGIFVLFALDSVFRIGRLTV